MKILGRSHLFTGNEFVRSKRPTADGYDMPYADLVSCHRFYPQWISVCSVFGGCWKGKRIIENMEKMGKEEHGPGADVMLNYEFAEFEDGELLPELDVPSSFYLVKQWGVDTRSDEYVQFYVDNHNRWNESRMSLMPSSVVCPECGGRVVECKDMFGTTRKCFECGEEINARSGSKWRR